MAKIDLSKFAFDGKQIQDISELVWEILRETGNAFKFVTTYPNIKVDTEVGFFGEGGLVGVKSTGCDPQPQDFQIGTRSVKWTPEDWEILLDMCYKEVEDTIASLGLHNGLRKPDLTDTQYMKIVVEALRKAMERFIWRFIWFNDKAAANVTDGGLVKDGIDPKYFNIIDGLWKQIFAQCVVNAGQHVTIAENSGASYALQALDDDKVRKMLFDMTFLAPLELRNLPGTAFYVTQSVYDSYYRSLTDVEKAAIEMREEKFINGMPTLKCNGYPVIAMPEWDRNISMYFDNGTTLHLPHRALLTNVKVLGAGFDSMEDFDKLDIWYEKKERKVYIEAMGNGDAKLLHPALFIAAY